MTNSDEGTVILEAGNLDKTCFASEQERFEAFARSLVFRKDLIQLIQGAAGNDGSDGSDGADGAQGPPGPAGPALTPESVFYSIPAGSTYITVTGLSIYQGDLEIKSKRNVGITYDESTDPPTQTFAAFDPADGIVGIGTLVEDLTNGNTRVYFLFSAGITSTPNDDFHLVHTKWT